MAYHKRPLYDDTQACSSSYQAETVACPLRLCEPVHWELRMPFSDPAALLRIDVCCWRLCQLLERPERLISTRRLVSLGGSRLAMFLSMMLAERCTPSLSPPRSLARQLAQPRPVRRQPSLHQSYITQSVEWQIQS